MKKLLLSTALISSLFAGDFFVGMNFIGGSGSVKITDSTYNYTFTDTDDISTSGLKIYAGSGKWYLFYQTGTVSPDTKYMSDHDYNVFGFGYLFQSKKRNFKVVDAGWYFDADLGYDKMTSSGNSEYDGDKDGVYVSFSLGASLALPSFDQLSLNAGIGYEVHAVNDSTSTSYDGSWNFNSFIFTTGVNYSF